VQVLDRGDAARGVSAENQGIRAAGMATGTGHGLFPDDAGADGRRGMNRLFAIYLAISGVALFFPHRQPGWLGIALAHLYVITLALGYRFGGSLVAVLRAGLPRVQGFLADWYPLLLIPVLYGELEPLNRAVYGGRYFDELIMHWEELLFGGQPSFTLPRAFNALPLSEMLHAAYLSYYFIIFGPPIILYLMGRKEAFRQVVFGVMFAFFLHYIFFIYFPVQGPRYIFPAPDGVIANGYFYQLAHRILEAGSSQGAAFPSSHVGIAFAQAALAVRVLPRLAPILFVLATFLALGAIYGGFHYATDAVAGLVLGLLAVALATPVRRLLSR